MAQEIRETHEPKGLRPSLRDDSSGMALIYFTLMLPAANIVVRYRYTGIGYAGRAAGPLPSNTVSPQGVRYNCILISGLARLSSLSLSNRANSTVTAEEMRSS